MIKNQQITPQELENLSPLAQMVWKIRIAQGNAELKEETACSNTPA